MATRHALFVSAALVLAAVPLTTAVAQADEISMDALPKAARDGLAQAAGNDKIEKVEQSTEKGNTTFEAKVRKADGSTYKIKVDPAGKLLKKD